MQDRPTAKSKASVPPQSVPESTPQSGRCKILAKKGFLTSKNITTGLTVLLYSAEFQLGVLFDFLPLESIDASGFLTEEQSFAKSAMAMILGEFKSLGVRKRDLLAYAVGGAATEIKLEVSATAVRQALWSYGLILTGSELGGKQQRSIWMDVESGRTIIRSEAIKSSAATVEQAVPLAS